MYQLINDHAQTAAFAFFWINIANDSWCAFCYRMYSYHATVIAFR